MYEGKRVVALIAAAGNGQRMGSSKPKQYLNLGNKNLLEKSTEAFEMNASVDDIYIIASSEYPDEIKKLSFSKIKKITEGGRTRQQSVYNGLKSIDGHADIVLIHDAARPYLKSALIDDVIKAVINNGAAIPALPVKDTIKITDNEYITETPDRDSLYSAQTPQGFDIALIIAAHEKARDDNFTGTDDSQLVERLGHKVLLVNGDEKNSKITVREDMEPGRLVGIGFDVHAFAENRDLILGGIKIPYERGLWGHSDADVLTHALMDAILGALNLGDIGTNFPDTDERYKGISSVLLLEKVRDMMIQKGYTLENADLIIVAEKPKMKEHTSLIRENLAEIMSVNPDKISIKATTTEGLGFTGREEGIGAQAIVQLLKNI